MVGATASASAHQQAVATLARSPQEGVILMSVDRGDRQERGRWARLKSLGQALWPSRLLVGDRRRHPRLAVLRMGCPRQRHGEEPGGQEPDWIHHFVSVFSVVRMRDRRPIIRNSKVLFVQLSWTLRMPDYMKKFQLLYELV